MARAPLTLRRSSSARVICCAAPCSPPPRRRGRGAGGASALIDRDVLEALLAAVLGLRANQAVADELLQYMRRPAGDAADRERRRIQVARQPHRVQHGRRVELDIGVEAPFGLALVEYMYRVVFGAFGQREELPRRGLARHLAQNLRARIVSALHTR